MSFLGEYWEYLGMGVVGLAAIVSWLMAWDARVPMRARWRFLTLSITLMVFIVFIVAVNVRFN